MPRCYCIGRVAKQGNKFQPVEGIVQQLNFAKNGKPNGAVLDSGHFVHMKPRGAQAVGLHVGQTLNIQGKLKGNGSDGPPVIEAEMVNGIDVTSAHPGKKAASKNSALKRAGVRKTASKKAASKKTRDTAN